MTTDIATVEPGDAEDAPPRPGRPRGSWRLRLSETLTQRRLDVEQAEQRLAELEGADVAEVRAYVRRRPVAKLDYATLVHERRAERQKLETELPLMRAAVEAVEQAVGDEARLEAEERAVQLLSEAKHAKAAEADAVAAAGALLQTICERWAEMADASQRRGAIAREATTLAPLLDPRINADLHAATASPLDTQPACPWTLIMLLWQAQADPGNLGLRPLLGHVRGAPSLHTAARQRLEGPGSYRAAYKLERA